MNIAVGCDHAGFSLKRDVVVLLEELGHTVVDCGADRLDPEDDYPDSARRVGESIQRGEAARGILLCGSGVGASIAASKLTGIRAAVCHDVYSAHQGVEHDDMNVLCLGARIIGVETAGELVRAFAGAVFRGEGKYLRRVEKIMAMERHPGTME